MKQIAIGRKSWLFSGSVAGGGRSARFMALVSSALRNDLDVWQYVKDVLDQLFAGMTGCEPPLFMDLGRGIGPRHIPRQSANIVSRSGKIGRNENVKNEMPDGVTKIEVPSRYANCRHVSIDNVPRFWCAITLQKHRFVVQITSNHDNLAHSQFLLRESVGKCSSKLYFLSPIPSRGNWPFL